MLTMRAVVTAPMIGTLLWVIASISANSAASIKVCNSDSDCGPDTFCSNATIPSHCTSCLDCQLLKRVNTGNCSRGSQDCGPCVPGFIPLSNDGNCAEERLMEATQKAKESGDFNSTESKPSDTSSEYEQSGTSSEYDDTDISSEYDESDTSSEDEHSGTSSEDQPSGIPPEDGDDDSSAIWIVLGLVAAASLCILLAVAGMARKRRRGRSADQEVPAIRARSSSPENPLLLIVSPSVPVLQLQNRGYPTDENLQQRAPTRAQNGYVMHTFEDRIILPERENLIPSSDGQMPARPDLNPQAAAHVLMANPAAPVQPSPTLRNGRSPAESIPLNVVRNPAEAGNDPIREHEQPVLPDVRIRPEDIFGENPRGPFQNHNRESSHDSGSGSSSISNSQDDLSVPDIHGAEETLLRPQDHRSHNGSEIRVQQALGIEPDPSDPQPFPDYLERPLLNLAQVTSRPDSVLFPGNISA